jgi:hypothetical protein
MNSSQCYSSSLATDELFFLNPTACTTPTPAFLFVLVAAVLLKAGICVLQWMAWLARQRLREARATPNELAKVRAKLPLVAVLSTLHLVSQTLFFVLAALDLANARNGSSFVLWGLGFLFYGTQCLLYWMKMIRMGQRILPWVRHLGNTKSLLLGVTNKFTGSTAVLFGVGACLLAVQTVAFVILPFCLPRFSPVPAQLGFFANGWFNINCTVCVIFQMERCIRVSLDHLSSADRLADSLGPPLHKDRLDAILRGVRLLRGQEFIMLCVGGSTGAVLILVVFAFPPYWYVLVAVVSLESVGQLGISLSIVKSIHASRKRRGGDDAALIEKTQPFSSSVTLVAEHTGGPVLST